MECIEHLSLFENITQEPITHFQPFCQALRRCGRSSPKAKTIFNLLADWIACLHFLWAACLWWPAYPHRFRGAGCRAHRSRTEWSFAAWSFPRSAHHLVNGFLWNALAFVNRRNVYNNHLKMIIQRLLTIAENQWDDQRCRPIHHYPFTSSYNFGNLDTTFAGIAGRSITSPYCLPLPESYSEPLFNFITARNALIHCFLIRKAWQHPARANKIRPRAGISFAYLRPCRPLSRDF